MKTKIIFTKKLANHLVKKGFKCVDTQINTKNPKLFVFLFEDTPALEEEMNSFLSQLKKEG